MLDRGGARGSKHGGSHEYHSDDAGRQGLPSIRSSAVASMLKRDSKVPQSVHDCRMTSRLAVTLSRCILRMPWSWNSFLAKARS